MIKTHPVNMDFSDDLRPVNTMTEWVCEKATDEQLDEAQREWVAAYVSLILGKLDA